MVMPHPVTINVLLASIPDWLVERAGNAYLVLPARDVLALGNELMRSTTSVTFNTSIAKFTPPHLTFKGLEILTTEEVKEALAK